MRNQPNKNLIEEYFSVVSLLQKGCQRNGAISPFVQLFCSVIMQFLNPEMLIFILIYDAAGSTATPKISNSCMAFAASLYTLQTFNSCTSRPDVCQCLVVGKTQCIRCQQNKPNTSIINVACESKLRSVMRSEGPVVASTPWKLVAIGRRLSIMPGLSRQLEQEFNVRTVAYCPV